MFCFHVVGPFQLSTKFLLVGDFDQQDIFAIQPETGEVRALLDASLFYSPSALAFDPQLAILYVAYSSFNAHTLSYRYAILKKSLDGRIHAIIHRSESGM